MKKAINNVIAYGMWIIDIALAFWLVYTSRNAYLGIFALSYQPGSYQYGQVVGFLDKAFIIILALGWLGFMIIVIEYFSAGIRKGNLLSRVAKVTGAVLLCLGGVDLILFWLQGTGSGDWLIWLKLACELGIGLAMLIFAKTKIPEKSN